jgi:hypothetical protein
MRWFANFSILRAIPILVLTLPATMDHAAAIQNSTPNGFSIPTSLRIDARGPSGESLSLKSAEMFLDVWNGGDLVPVSRDAGAAILKLDHAWLCDASPEICKIWLGESRLILKAEGYAPVTAKVFWPGQPRPAGSAASSGTDIEFSGGLSAHLEEGDSKQLVVPFRKPVKRSIRVIDEHGQGVSGLRLESSIFYNRSNHCAVIRGELLAMGETAVDGTFQFPDVDGEVAFQFSRSHFELLPPGLPDTDQWIFTPSEAVATIRIHKFEKHSLNLQINGPAANLPGLNLQAYLKNCGCGSCGGDIPAVQSRGRFHVENFYPEEEDLIAITNANGVMLWQGDPNSMPAAAVQIVTLPDDAISIYALIDKVEPVLAADSTPRIRIWGTFSIVRGPTDAAPARGYLYFELPPGLAPEYADAAKREWKDLDSFAGSGVAIGFGLRGIDNPSRSGPPPRLHSREEQVPPYLSEEYPAGAGVSRLDSQTHSDVIHELRVAAGLN